MNREDIVRHLKAKRIEVVWACETKIIGRDDKEKSGMEIRESEQGKNQRKDWMEDPDTGRCEEDKSLELRKKLWQPKKSRMR